MESIGHFIPCKVQFCCLCFQFFNQMPSVGVVSSFGPATLLKFEIILFNLFI